MKFLSIFFKVKPVIAIEDMLSSRYISIYNYHKKKTFKKYLEKATLDKVNEYLKENFPKRINKDHKKIIIDCVVIFLKFLSIHYNYWPGDKIFNAEFERIIIKNIEKLNN